MEPIIEPVSRSLLLAELTPERKVRNTNKASNEIYIFDAAECPSLFAGDRTPAGGRLPVGGGGTGLAVDIDEEDLAGDGYYQLIVWDFCGAGDRGRLSLYRLHVGKSPASFH